MAGLGASLCAPLAGAALAATAGAGGASSALPFFFPAGALPATAGTTGTAAAAFAPRPRLGGGGGGGGGGASGFRDFISSVRGRHLPSSSHIETSSANFRLPGRWGV